MIRFVCVENDSKTTVNIAGKLEADHLGELEAHRVAARQPLVFDLSELQSADEASIRWLCARREKGDRVTGTSPYITLRLERGLKRPESEAARTPTKE